MGKLIGKKILLALTGGIAAYKSAELCRLLKKSAADVRVVMTRGACEFISPLTLQALSGNAVHTELLDPDAEAGMGHIELAKWPDMIIVAPATASFIAKYHAGIADDLLCTLLLASQKPVVLAPAMNQAMWQHATTQRNIKQLKVLMSEMLTILGPANGEQACGDTGPGRMVEPEFIVEALIERFSVNVSSTLNKPLRHKKVVITAGPTREALDPVRYISNHSSGKMGYALAEAFYQLGAEVVLVSGPCQQKANESVNVVSVVSAQDMYESVHAEIDRGCDIFIGCAAVADYRPVHVAEQKIKKTDNNSSTMHLTLEQNPDILASVATRTDRPYTVGFAAETHDVLQYARDKLIRKKLDLIIANDVSKVGQGFNSESNEVCLITNDHEYQLGLEQKRTLAVKIAEFVAGQVSQNT